MPRISIKAAVIASVAGFAVFVSSGRGIQAQEILPGISTGTARGSSSKRLNPAVFSRARILRAGRALARVVGKGLLQSPASFNPDGSATEPDLLLMPLGAARSADPADAVLAPAKLSKTAPQEEPSPPATASVAAPRPKPHKMFEDRAYLISSIAFHAAGAFDLASTIYGISHIPWDSEHNQVFLALFGKKNARNIPLITTGWLATHLSVQFVARFLFRHAKKEAKKHHKYKRLLFDAAALGLLAFGVIWHIDAASTWYGPGRL